MAAILISFNLQINFLLLDDLDGPCPLFTLLSGQQTSPAFLNLSGYLDETR